jgi:hypothetical protein
MFHLYGDMIFGQNMGELHDQVKDLAAKGETASTVVLLRPSIRVRNSLDLIRVTSMFEVVADEAELLGLLS